MSACAVSSKHCGIGWARGNDRVNPGKSPVGTPMENTASRRPRSTAANLDCHHGFGHGGGLGAQRSAEPACAESLIAANASTPAALFNSIDNTSPTGHRSRRRWST